MTSAKEAEDSLQDILLREIKSRANVSTKFRTARGTFAKKDVEDLSWKNYVRHFFDQHPGFKTTCSGCEKSYDKAESFLTHLRRSQIAREPPPPPRARRIYLGTCLPWDVTKTGNGERGMGNGNGEWGMGNGEWRMGNGEWGMGNGEWEIMGNCSQRYNHRKVRVRASSQIQEWRNTSHFSLTCTWVAAR